MLNLKDTYRESPGLYSGLQKASCMTFPVCQSHSPQNGEAVIYFIEFLQFEPGLLREVFVVI